MSLKCDILVVGAGPGGSGAAKAAAENGAKTICIDKKTVIGLPVECGEAVGQSLARDFNINIAPETISMKHEGTVFYANQNIKIDNCLDIWKSMSVNRHLLDKSFANEAVQSGAKLMVNAEFIDAELDDKNIKSVKVMHRNNELTIEPKVVIAADGVKSKLAELLGRRAYKEFEIGKVAGYEMVNVNLTESNKIQMFFEDMCGMGYGYIIPKSKNSANVGLGSLGLKQTPWDVFDEFLEEHPIVAPQVKEASIIEVKAGQAPISGPIISPVIGNTLFVGDAAGQNLSHVGEGAVPSQICGRIAGSVAAKAIKSNDNSHLQNYPITIKNTIGPLFDHCDRIREKIIETWTSELPPEKKYLIGTILVSEIIPPESRDIYKNFKQYDNKKIVDEVSNFLKKQKFDVQISKF